MGNWIKSEIWGGEASCGQERVVGKSQVGLTWVDGLVRGDADFRTPEHICRGCLLVISLNVLFVSVQAEPVHWKWVYCYFICSDIPRKNRDADCKNIPSSVGILLMKTMM